VLAVDTGYGQIAHKLRVDARVKLMERCNARLLGAGELAVIGSQLSVEKADSSAALRNDKQMALRNDKQEAAISFLAMDVSFISATLVLPAVLRALVGEGERWRGEAVVLVKPQFEAGREHVGKGGIVREQAGREIAIERMRECVVGLGGTGVEVIDSPITGMEGNQEYLLHAWFGEANA
jgi:23S rRNA (cytidine1920-2'-O)/16S rRNA (cytidine1409-2'-O)-methyltransferase